MILSPEAWVRNLRLWLPQLVFFLLALGLLVFYRTALADDAELGQARLARRAEDLEAVRSDRERVASYLERASALEEGIEQFFGVRLTSEAASLTRIIAEIKALSQQAGLAPQQITYDKEDIEDEEVMRRSLVFPVVGNYRELRQLINFLELSDSFLILEEVRLRTDEGGGDNLRIDLVISTLFLEGNPKTASTGEGAP